MSFQAPPSLRYRQMAVMPPVAAVNALWVAADISNACGARLSRNGLTPSWPAPPPAARAAVLRIAWTLPVAKHEHDSGCKMRQRVSGNSQWRTCHVTGQVDDLLQNPARQDQHAHRAADRDRPADRGRSRCQADQQRSLSLVQIAAHGPARSTPRWWRTGHRTAPTAHPSPQPSAPRPWCRGFPGSTDYGNCPGRLTGHSPGVPRTPQGPRLRRRCRQRWG